MSFLFRRSSGSRVLLCRCVFCGPHFNPGRTILIFPPSKTYVLKVLFRITLLRFPFSPQRVEKPELVVSLPANVLLPTLWCVLFCLPRQFLCRVLDSTFFSLQGMVRTVLLSQIFDFGAPSSSPSVVAAFGIFPAASARAHPRAGRAGAAGRGVGGAGRSGREGDGGGAQRANQRSHGREYRHGGPGKVRTSPHCMSLETTSWAG